MRTAHPTCTTVKVCVICGDSFRRHSDETKSRFEGRETCSPKCGIEKTKRTKRERQSAGGYHAKRSTGAIIAPVEWLDSPTPRQRRALAELSPDVRERLLA